MTDAPRPAPSAELLTVIIPCFNEQDSIDLTVREVLMVAERLPMALEILLVDDGSTDATPALMRAWAAQDPRCRVLANSRNLGVGSALLAAFEQVREGSWVTGIPGDAEFVFDSILPFVEARAHHDLILGYIGNPVIRPMRRRLSSRAFTRISALLYGFPYKYLNGMKLYRIEVFRGIEVTSRGHAFTAELLAKALLRSPSLRVGELPFQTRGRAKGASKAFKPAAVTRAIREAIAGHEAVTRYRDRIIEEQEVQLKARLGRG